MSSRTPSREKPLEGVLGRRIWTTLRLVLERRKVEPSRTLLQEQSTKDLLEARRGTENLGDTNSRGTL